MIRKLPVLNAAGQLVGSVTSSGHKAAAILAGAPSVKQEFREVAGRRVLCWIPADDRAARAERFAKRLAVVSQHA